MRGVVLMLGLLGCADPKTSGDERPQRGDHSYDADADTDADADADADADTDADADADAVGGDDTGEPESTPAYLEPGAFEGSLDVHLVYEGIYGHYENDCPGSVDFTIDEAFELDGSGSCTLDTVDVEMGFFIEGSQDNHQVTGVLIMESATDRVETAFTGSRNAVNVQISFDTIHMNDGEQLQVSGNIVATAVE